MVTSKSIIFSLLIAALVWSFSYLWVGAEILSNILKTHWEVSLTMLFGSFIAGATSEGGGAIAFPIFTKVLHTTAFEAKVFSLAIQSVGMSAASLVILVMKTKLEWRVIFWASLGGVPGLVIGAAWLTFMLPATLVKMSFTVMVSSFALTLYVVNRNTRYCYLQLPVYTVKEIILLIIAGFVGGLMSGLVGNGIDIISFSLVVLLFRVSEKVATPTSVVLMALNALFGFFLHLFYLGGFTPKIEAFWWAAVPVVVIGAPIGAMCCSLLRRKTIATILIVLIIIELATSLLLIPLTERVMIVSFITWCCFSSVYFWMYRCGYYASNNIHLKSGA
jgi:uncharacterized protein